jgi:hypothetical protein
MDDEFIFVQSFSHVEKYASIRNLHEFDYLQDTEQPGLPMGPYVRLSAALLLGILVASPHSPPEWFSSLSTWANCPRKNPLISARLAHSSAESLGKAVQLFI